MKKTMFAVAATMAFGLVANAADSWFDTKIDTYTEWPTNNAAEFGGTWTNTAAATLEGKELKVSTDAETPLAFEATDTVKVAEKKVTVTSTLTFTPFSTLPDVPETAKAGVIAFKTSETTTNFYVVAKDASGKNVWTDSGITATETAVVKVTFTDGDNATYDIAGASTNVAIKTIETIKKVCLSGDGAIAALSATTETKAVGPTPASGSETSVEKVEGEDNTYKIAPTGTGTTVAVDNVKSGDTLIINGGNVDTLGLNSAEGVTIKVMNKAGAIEITKAVKGLSGKTFDATLDTNKTVEVQVDATTVKVPVIPTLIEETDAAKPFVVGSDVSTTVQSIPGLTYKLRRDEVPDGEYATTAASATAEENKATLTLKDANKPEGKAFYIIEVTK